MGWENLNTLQGTWRNDMIKNAEQLEIINTISLATIKNYKEMGSDSYNDNVHWFLEMVFMMLWSHIWFRICPWTLMEVFYADARFIQNIASYIGNKHRTERCKDSLFMNLLFNLKTHIKENITITRNWFSWTYNQCLLKS